MNSNNNSQTDRACEELLDFIHNSPSSFHAVDTIAKALKAQGFTHLDERSMWDLKAGGSYFVTRNDTAIISFVIPHKKAEGFSIVASHSDSPSFKVKENCEMKKEGKYTVLNVERYGGMLCAPWLDRPLSVAGRVICKSDDKSQNSVHVVQKLVNVDRPFLMIPNLAIHMNRQANDGYAYNAQKDMLPVFACGADEGDFISIIAEEAKVEPKDILSYDLFLYDRTQAVRWGAHNEFIASPRLDDLECAFTSLKAFIGASNPSRVIVHAVFDNEEVGSESRQGAASTFLHDTLKRINEQMGRSEEEYLVALANSFMVSADNAHAVHPNHSDVADPVNRPVINGGPVIKYHAGQKYTTDAFSAAVFKQLCERAEVPYQTFTNRSDMAGGSTLGNISNTQVSIPAVDIGIAQWAMHSPYESAGALDVAYMGKVLRCFYETEHIELKN